MSYVRWIVPSMALAMLAAACAVPASGGGSEEEPSAPEATPQSFEYNIVTEFFSDATHDHLVGSCVIDDCTHMDSCTGMETEYFTTHEVVCN